MPTSHDLDGLVKFLAREQWRRCFEEVFDDHFGAVLDAGDLEFGDLAEILGDHWMSTLWGCAFEDFLTNTFDVEGGNIVDDYLKRRGWKERAQAKAYMKGLRTSVMSLYEVSDIVPGQSLKARDIIRGGQPLLVSEGTATKTLRLWDKIAARIVPVMGKNILGGGLLPFTPQATEMLLDELRQIFAKRNARKLPAIKDDDLQAVAAIFTTTWLLDALERATHGPELRNAEGDAIIYHDVRFPLASGVRQKDVATRLDGIRCLSQENAKFWNWLEDPPKAEAQRGGGLRLDTTMDSGLRVLGNVELKGRFLTLATNSAARAEKGTTLIRKALGDLIGAPQVETRDIETLVAEDHTGDHHAGTGTDMPPEMAEQVIHEFMDRQYRETLDRPIPMLGDSTPLQAAKSAAGRQRVVDWLKHLENQAARQDDPADPMATYSFEWMWKELGVLDQRR